MVRIHDAAVRHPDKVAVCFPGQNRVVTYAELDERANRVAHWLIGLGLPPGAGIAMLLENHPRIAEIAIGAKRAGLYYTPLSTHLKTREIAHVLKDCGARLLITSAAMAELAQAIAAQGTTSGMACFMIGGTAPGYLSYEDAIDITRTAGTLPERPLGRDFLYSSGTTGLPKGIRKPLVPYAERNRPDLEISTWQQAFGFDDDTIYLSSAPLYHAAPLRYLTRTLETGGTCIVLEKFDAAQTLAVIERYRVTHSQWVPTMFVRLLDLPQDVRNRHDLSSMRVAIHAAAPCPPHIKERMIAWWGPVISEYYSGSEGLGMTAIDSHEWLLHRGSVGRARLGRIHIVDEDSNDLPVGEVGRVFFEGGPRFEYHNDPEKTRNAHNSQGWATYGDLGRLDADGYLYLSERRADLIISGGVNVYPQEIENLLSEHPAVRDVAVVGVPHAEYGEEVRAIVQLREPDKAGDALADALIAFCREHLSSIKVPKSVVFERTLPRHDNGKLLRRELKARYR